MTPPHIIATEFATPAGPLAVFGRLEASGEITVVGSGFTDLAGMVARMGGRAPLEWLRVAESDAAWARLRATLADYFAGSPTALSGVSVDQAGGAFTQNAWDALRRIPAGETRTYAQLALDAGNPRAVRAAGTACARNLVAPFVPCHRVVRSGGDVGNYAFGSDVKRQLLRWEAGGSRLASPPEQG